jgi:hypothetical protein
LDAVTWPPTVAAVERRWRKLLERQQARCRERAGR